MKNDEAKHLSTLPPTVERRRTSWPPPKLPHPQVRSKNGSDGRKDSALKPFLAGLGGGGSGGGAAASAAEEEAMYVVPADEASARSRLGRTRSGPA